MPMSTDAQLGTFRRRDGLLRGTFQSEPVPQLACSRNNPSSLQFMTQTCGNK
ncbi:MAG: hypothetical protein RJA70_722 [Pseudomonadota bacterium]|jgi:hypothetical protein